MPGIDFDLNENPPESEVDQHIDWDSLAEFDGPAHDLAYAMVWDEGTQVSDDGGTDGVEGQNVGVEGQGEDAVQGQNVGMQDPGEDAVQGQNVGVQGRGNDGSNEQKRRFYPDDVKIAIYLELLAKTDPPMLHRGVSKQVAAKFGVPLRVVQTIWRNGQDHGIEGIRNKFSKNCGRKRIEIDLEAIKAVPLGQRSTFQDLANALGVKKSTLYNRFKEGYFRRHINDLKFSLADENKKARVKLGRGCF